MAVVPRRPKGPPLNALRAFEAAARLESFVAAAEELNVTAGAVSQHIKAVETWAGTALFERNAQGVTLSAPARSLRDEFAEAFDLLSTATQKMRNFAPSPTLNIAALPSIAQLWLPPRLGRLRESHPNLNVSVTALENPPKLSREFFDLSLFLSRPEPGPDQAILAEDAIFPVCSPKLSVDLDLEKAPLLHDQNWQSDWRIWSEQTHVPIGDPTRGARYSLYALAVEEAKSGAGVLMGHASLIAAALRAGDLVRVSEDTAQTGFALVINLPHRSRRHPDIETVIDALGNFQL